MSSQENVIKVQNISKCYRIGLREKMQDSFGALLLDFMKKPVSNYRKYRSLYTFNNKELSSDGNGEHMQDLIWVLRDVCFEVRKGEVLGIIGRNGAGKSTLLKILSGITEPTKGRAEIRGKVSSLLEVGTGFHPELTGRENVYLNGAILGMKKKQIDRLFDEIVDFSGVREFIDTPIKRYSSGMKVRLAFAVAANLQPEILVIDEVLAVGDAEFQNKCLGKMKDITSEGRTVLFVSHNMGAVIQLCPSSILLEEGRIISKGPSKEVVEKYLSSIFKPVNSQDLRDVPVRDGDGRMRFISAQLRMRNGQYTTMPVSGQPIDIVLGIESRECLEKVKITLTIFNQMGIAVTSCSVASFGRHLSLPKGSKQIICCIPKLPLPLGQYKIALAASDDMGELDWIPTACIFDVQTSNFFETSFTPPMRYSTALIEHRWQFSDAQTHLIPAGENL
jgi:lipopolysaccharide transport system ATP-binding protein